MVLFFCLLMHFLICCCMQCSRVYSGSCWKMFIVAAVQRSLFCFVTDITTQQQGVCLCSLWASCMSSKISPAPPCQKSYTWKYTFDTHSPHIFIADTRCLRCSKTYVWRWYDQRGWTLMDCVVTSTLRMTSRMLRCSQVYKHVFCKPSWTYCCYY